ncbi:hypothetical protein Stube_61920 [Streptomyces tubercidicus]|uniref:Uncharacterized protein n=1 Tax=Streptomyces tubercidicus TaxID=47759 RepID=A0A640V011_9ACTN|nr:hypothetical protein Stube_61920 [Streptomyces tubercidicus]
MTGNGTADAWRKLGGSPVPDRGSSRVDLGSTWQSQEKWDFARFESCKQPGCPRAIEAYAAAVSRGNGRAAGTAERTAVGLPPRLAHTAAAAGISPPAFLATRIHARKLLRFRPVHRAIHRDRDRNRPQHPLISHHHPARISGLRDIP